MGSIQGALVLVLLGSSASTGASQVAPAVAPAPSPIRAQEPSQGMKNWAWDLAKAWTVYRKNAQGREIYPGVKFLELPYAEQNQALLERLESHGSTRRAALLILGDRPLVDWARPALRQRGARDEVALLLHRKGYRYPDQDPFVYLEPSSRLDRPWTQGLGLHLEGEAWRFQWIPSPVLLPSLDAQGEMPRALHQAPQPGALVRLKALRSGLQRLQALAGGGNGLTQTLLQGSRAGFFLRHLEPWMQKAAPVLEPLSAREAWVLHYGRSREGSDLAGTLLFLPGELPTRTKLFLELLKLNPLSGGARSRTATWRDGKGASVEITQVRGSGGVLHLYTTPEGSWVSDREGLLRAVIWPTAHTPLGERSEWCRVALAGALPATEVSLWVVPSLSATAAFERTTLRRRLQGATQPTWPNPFIAKAAPRGGTLTLALGAGPTEVLIQSLLRVDRPGEIPEPTLPEPLGGQTALSSDQLQDFQKEREQVRGRNRDRGDLRKDLQTLLAHLDLRGLALTTFGWTRAPEPDAQEKAAQAAFRARQKESPREAARLQRTGRAEAFGGFGEPGLTPSVALALAVKEGASTAAEQALTRLLPRLFRGRTEARTVNGVLLHRLRTEQAFTPCFAFAEGHLVLGSNDQAVEAVVAGLKGQAPTLADIPDPSPTYGRGELDYTGAAQDLAGLLEAYLRSHRGGSPWWFGEPAPTADEVDAELEEVFRPFLGALRDLGRKGISLAFTPAGLEVKPR